MITSAPSLLSHFSGHGGDTPARLTFRLGLSPEEIERELPRLCPPGHAVRRLATHRWRLGPVVMALSPLPPRQTGALCLPRTEMELDLHDLPPTQRSLLLSRLARALFRGGG
jgi:hypothetical protein